jgi:hypothetical protein
MLRYLREERNRQGTNSQSSHPAAADCFRILALSRAAVSWVSGRGAPMKLDDKFLMAYPQKMVEAIILGLVDPLNQHLVKLAGFAFPAEQRRHFRREATSWLNKIQRLRMKPTNRTGSVKFYFDHLFDYPFGGNEVPAMRAMMEFISSEYDGIRPVKSPEQVVAWLKSFHMLLAQRLHNGEAVVGMVPD